MLSFMARKISSIQVDYDEYTVSKSIIHLFKDWHRGVKRNEYDKHFVFIQNYSHWIPRLFPFVTIITTILFIAKNHDVFLGKGVVDVVEYTNFIAYSICGVYIAYTLSMWLAKSAERAIDSWSPLSYIKITNGDSRSIEKFKNNNRWKLWASSLSALFSILMALSSKLAISIIVSYLISPK